MHESSESQPSARIGGTPPDQELTASSFVKLCEVIARLRSPDGCPWDREQTLETIKPYTLEETYELLEAIDAGNDDEIVEELGDLLLQIVLDCQIADDENRFNIIPVIERITDKMIRRHPHVFGDAQASSAAEVSTHWDQAKREEKQHRESQFDGIPVALPQLARAARLSKRAARVGYDWPDRHMLFDKLNEELQELADELFPEGRIPEVPAGVSTEPLPDEPIEDPELRSRVESELGDVLFVVANIARRWGINPEEALRRTNEKFIRRFQFIEAELKARGITVHEASLQEMEDIYQDGKSREG